MIISKSEIRSTKFETISNDQNTNDQNKNECKDFLANINVLNFEYLIFGFVSNFVLRASDFEKITMV